jgi:hypothetical protein
MSILAGHIDSSLLLVYVKMQPDRLTSATGYKINFSDRELSPFVHFLFTCVVLFICHSLMVAEGFAAFIKLIHS